MPRSMRNQQCKLYIRNAKYKLRTRRTRRIRDRHIGHSLHDGHGDDGDDALMLNNNSYH
jgi:hypothetical protein